MEDLELELAVAARFVPLAWRRAFFSSRFLVFCSAQLGHKRQTVCCSVFTVARPYQPKFSTSRLARWGPSWLEYLKHELALAVDTVTNDLAAMMSDT